MREDIAGSQGASSRPMWETLEGMVREKAQEFIQQIMEEEVTELLGREKSERRSTVDSAEAPAKTYRTIYIRTHCMSHAARVLSGRM